MGEEADLRTELFLRSLELAYLEERARAYAPLKMLIDFVGAFALLVALSPILFVCALLTKLEQPWEPVFFLQWRLGHRAKPFRIFKFRTMRPARETASHGKPLAKEDHEYRVTKLGAFLRKYKLDELPQLFNVLSGSMSLIGPRPLSLFDSASIDPKYYNRYAVRPGMTGLWQSRHSSFSDGELKLRLDCEYAERIGFRIDVEIVLSTIPMVLRGEERSNAARPGRTGRDRAA